MATIKLEIVAGAQTFTRTRTVSAAHLTRFIAASRVYFGMGPSTTDAQVAEEWFARIYRDATAITKQVEQSTAVKSAADGVIDITIS